MVKTIKDKNYNDYGFSHRCQGCAGKRKSHSCGKSRPYNRTIKRGKKCKKKKCQKNERSFRELPINETIIKDDGDILNGIFKEPLILYLSETVLYLKNTRGLPSFESTDHETPWYDIYYGPPMENLFYPAKKQKTIA